MKACRPSRLAAHAVPVRARVLGQEKEVSEITQVTQDHLPGEPLGGIPGFLHFAGFRYWSASLLPALVGTTLPFWLRPPGFSFKWLGGVEFLLATVLLHAGFSFLQAWFEKRSTAKWPRSRLLRYGCACIALACLLGLLINSGLRFNGNIFIIGSAPQPDRSLHLYAQSLVLSAA